MHTMFVSKRAQMCSTVVTYPDIAFIWLKHWFEKRRVLVLSGTAWPWPVTIKGHTFGKCNSFWLLQTLWSSVITLSRRRTRCRTWISWRTFAIQKLKKKYLWSRKNENVLCKKKKIEFRQVKKSTFILLKIFEMITFSALNACECI